MGKGWCDPWVLPVDERRYGYLAVYDCKGEDGDKWTSPWFEVGDWAFGLEDADTRRFVELVSGLLQERLFEPVEFHMPGDLEDLGRGGGPLDLRVELGKDGLRLDLLQIGQHTGHGVTVPHEWIGELASVMTAALNR